MVEQVRQAKYPSAMAGHRAGSGSPDTFDFYENIGGGMPSPGEVPTYNQTYVLTCNATGDGITSETGPVSAEIWTLQCPDNCVGMEVELDYSPASGDIPVARGFLFAVGVADALGAIEAMTVSDIGPNTTTVVGNEGLEYVGLDTVLTAHWKKGTVANVFAGALLTLNTGAGTASPVKAYVKMRVEA